VVSLVDFLKRANLNTYETFQDKLIQFIRRTPGLYADKPEVVGQSDLIAALYHSGVSNPVAVK
jgi:hypothetical protein